MRKSKEHFRHEWKYLINRAEKQLTDLRLRECMQLDPHAGEGGYMIRSLYFDDYWNSAMEEKDAGVLMRKKYRIRIYNCSDKSIKLERKKKFGSYIPTNSPFSSICFLAWRRIISRISSVDGRSISSPVRK